MGREDRTTDPTTGGVDPMEFFGDRGHLDPVSKKRLYALLDDPERMNNANDTDVKQLYISLKQDAYGTEQGKVNFTRIDKSIKAMVKQDCKRWKTVTVNKHFKRIFLLTLVLFPIATLFEGVRLLFPTELSEVIPIVMYNLEVLYNHAPFGLSILCVMIASFFSFISLGILLRMWDRRLCRRIHCKAIGEDMNLNDVVHLKLNTVDFGVADAAWFYPLREYRDGMSERCTNHSQ